MFLIICVFYTPGRCEEARSSISHSQCYHLCRGSSRDLPTIFILHLITERGKLASYMIPTFLLEDIRSCPCPMTSRSVSIMEATRAAADLHLTPISPPGGQTKC